MAADPVDLCTVDDVKMQMVSASSSQDALIQSLVTHASHIIIDWSSRELAPKGTQPEARLYAYDGAGTVSLGPWDAQTVTQVRIDTDTPTPTTLTLGVDYWVRPIQRIRYGVIEWIEIPSQRSQVWGSLSYGYGRLTTGIDRELEVTGTWGFPKVPSQAAEACVATVRAWLSREGSGGWNADNPMGDVPVGPGNVYWLPISARRLLSGLRRRGIG